MRQDAESVESSLVLPRSARDARLLRPLDGRRGAAEPDHGGIDGDSVHRHQQAGNGYYTINQRKFAYLTFQYGFLELWVTLIILGTFFRGPNWNIFGPFEYWDPHKVLALNNIDLSQYVWVMWLDRGMPKAPTGSSAWVEALYIICTSCPVSC